MRAAVMYQDKATRGGHQNRTRKTPAELRQEAWLLIPRAVDAVRGAEHVGADQAVIDRLVAEVRLQRARVIAAERELYR
jgi:hypothetical protein